MHRVPVSSSCVVSEETCAILKKAMADRHARWPKKEWLHKTKPLWRPLAGGEGKWKEISVEMDALVTTVQEKTNTWNKSNKESAKR